MNIPKLAKKVTEYVLATSINTEGVVKRTIATNESGDGFFDVTSVTNPDYVYFEVTIIGKNVKVREMKKPLSKRQLNMALTVDTIEKLQWIADQNKRSVTGTIDWIVEREYREMTGEKP